MTGASDAAIAAAAGGGAAAGGVDGVAIATAAAAAVAAGGEAGAGAGGGTSFGAILGDSALRVADCCPVRAWAFLLGALPKVDTVVFPLYMVSVCAKQNFRHTAYSTDTGTTVVWRFSVVPSDFNRHYTGNRHYSIGAITAIGTVQPAL